MPVMPMARMTRSTVSLAGAVPVSPSVAVTLSSCRTSLVHAGPGMDGHALLGEGLARKGGDLGVLGRKDAVEQPRPRSLRRRACGRSSRTRCRWRRSRSPATIWERPAAPWRACRSRPACRRPRAPAAPRARAPVAITICLASMLVRASPSLPVIATLPSPFSAALPVDHRDLVLLHQVGDAARELSPRLSRLRSTTRGEVEAEIVAGEAELRRHGRMA